MAESRLKWIIFKTITLTQQKTINPYCTFSPHAGTATRYCDQTDGWQKPLLLECTSNSFRNLRIKVSLCMCVCLSLSVCLCLCVSVSVSLALNFKMSVWPSKACNSCILMWHFMSNTCRWTSCSRVAPIGARSSPWSSLGDSICPSHWLRDCTQTTSILRRKSSPSSSTMRVNRTRPPLYLLLSTSFLRYVS